MIRITGLVLPIDYTPEVLREAVLQRLGIADSDVVAVELFRRSLDARQRQGGIRFNAVVDVSVHDEAAVLLRLAGDNNVLERGREVRQRTQDTWGLWRRHQLDVESNVQFGEGGAGLFSDGKLYSQIKDPRFLGRKVTQEFVKAGAPPEILYLNRPHIGTFRLTGIVAAMREEIRRLGGEVRFETRVEELLLEPAAAGQFRLRGVRLADGSELLSRHVVLAPGHSARDTFRRLHAQGVYIEAKPFAIGVRIEHPQSLIDRARLGPYAGHPVLGEVLPSYRPGVRLCNLADILPAYATTAMREALPHFARQIRDYDRDDAVLTGVETRTSSPIRLRRDPESLQSLNVQGLYPGGEGAGYAGGILSAAVDGIKLAEAVARDLCGSKT